MCSVPPQDFDECLKLIEQVLEESDNLCEFALFNKALIKRHNGETTMRMHAACHGAHAAWQPCAWLQPGTAWCGAT